MLSLREAVNTVNNELEQRGQLRRVGYAHVPFGPENCLFAPASWLFGLTKIKGAVRITLDELERDVKKIPEAREIITYCT
ncbi:MAG: hypothetical protein HY265_02715 [Deltaproteobacteria bacterium]|nr:hypothetical protein [Deltaproteobacteria bacterium]MBI3755059.1 hypothetical protein [Deltaproteobacteria bacterium]